MGDILYAHAQTAVWMFTGVYGSHPYHDRGWPFWESTVAAILTSSMNLYDISQEQDMPRTVKEKKQVFSKALAARPPPMLPHEFDEEIAKKVFTYPDIDRKRIQGNYRRNFTNALACVEHLDYTLYVKGPGKEAWGDAGAEKLSKVIWFCPCLRRLDLLFQDIGDDGAQAIANGFRQLLDMKRCLRLEKLNLQSNRVGDVGAQALAEILQHCDHLRFLSLEKTKIHNHDVILEVLGHTGAEIRI